MTPQPQDSRSAARDCPACDGPTCTHGEGCLLEVFGASSAAQGRDDCEIIRVGIGYTLATGRLFTRMDEFHAFAEHVLGRPILTHEFADTATWDDLRAAFEEEATNAAA